VRDRIQRARANEPRWDTDGRWAEACGELARSVGRDPGDVYEEHCERSAIRFYLGEFDTEEAERLAFEDVRARLTNDE